MRIRKAQPLSVEDEDHGLDHLRQSQGTNGADQSNKRAGVTEGGGVTSEWHWHCCCLLSPPSDPWLILLLSKRTT